MLAVLHCLCKAFNPLLVRDVLSVLACDVVFLSVFVVVATVGDVARSIPFRVAVGALPAATRHREGVAIAVVHAVVAVGIIVAFPFLRAGTVIVDLLAVDAQIHSCLVVGIEVEHKLLVIFESVAEGECEVDFVCLCRRNRWVFVIHHICRRGVGGAHDNHIHRHFAIDSAGVAGNACGIFVGFAFLLLGGVGDSFVGEVFLVCVLEGYSDCRPLRFVAREDGGFVGGRGVDYEVLCIDGRAVAAKAPHLPKVARDYVALDFPVWLERCFAIDNSGFDIIEHFHVAEV